MLSGLQGYDFSISDSSLQRNENIIIIRGIKMDQNLSKQTNGAECIVNTNCGAVRGVVENGYLCFKGIPYAMAERFKAPQKTSWSGIYDGTRFGKKAIQVYDRPMPWLKELPKREEFDEDCLNLNIYVPAAGEDGLGCNGSGEDGNVNTVAGADASCNVGAGEDGKTNAAAIAGKKLPVLVEIHGGAFQDGSNQGHTPDRVIVSHQFIYVPINYRLGALGFMPLDAFLGEAYAGSGNCGLLDQMSALRWIYENIQAFGGDPENITLLGSSAGAKSIGALMLMEELNTYVNQIILSSGATQSVRSLDTGTKTTEAFLKTAAQVLERHITASDLLTMPADDIIKIQKVYTDRPGNTCLFGPVADGAVIPVDWEPLAKNGTLWSGNAMIGSSRHELCFMQMMNPDLWKAASESAKGLFGLNAPLAHEVFDAFVEAERARLGHDPEDADKNQEWVRIFTDYMYRMYSYRLAKRMSGKGCHVWQYSVELLPAAHCFDQMLAFEGADAMFFRDEESLNTARALGQKIHETFAYFIENGTLCTENGQTGPSVPEFIQGWLPLTEENYCQMVWDKESKVVKIPKGDVLEGFPEGVYRL